MCVKFAVGSTTEHSILYRIEFYENDAPGNRLCNVENAVEPQLHKVKTNLAEFLGFYLSSSPSLSPLRRLFLEYLMAWWASIITPGDDLRYTHRPHFTVQSLHTESTSHQMLGHSLVVILFESICSVSVCSFEEFHSFERSSLQAQRLSFIGWDLICAWYAIVEICWRISGTLNLYPQLAYGTPLTARIPVVTMVVRGAKIQLHIRLEFIRQSNEKGNYKSKSPSLRERMTFRLVGL